jgi:hypothetical protein
MTVLREYVPVVHHEHFELLGVVDEELVETVGQQVSGVLVGACGGNLPDDN